MPFASAHAATMLRRTPVSAIVRGDLAVLLLALVIVVILLVSRSGLAV